jgi:hypothetical protein
MNLENVDYVEGGWAYPVTKMDPTQLEERDVLQMCEMMECEYSDREIAYTLNIHDKLIDMVRRKMVWQDLSDRFDYPIMQDFHELMDRVRETVLECDGMMDHMDISSMFDLPPSYVLKVSQELFPQDFTQPQ